jgi:hypothetical protein
MFLRSLLTKRAAGVSPRVPYQGHRLAQMNFRDWMQLSEFSLFHCLLMLSASNQNISA